MKRRIESLGNRAADVRVELLEPRAMLSGAAVVALWDGGGDGVSWQDARNWSADVLPLAQSQVRFEVPASVRITGEVTARSLTAMQGLSLDGGLLRLTDDAGVLNGFTLHAAAGLEAGGEICVKGGDVQVSGLLRGRIIGIDAMLHAVNSRGATISAGGDACSGTVVITGTTVTLRETRIEALGEAGGMIRIGGDVRGGQGIRAAMSVQVDHLTTLRADAMGKGDGGSVVVWSEERTRFAGSISARGGQEGGRGGTVEVSSKEVLTYRGTIDVTAPRGKAGSVLFDPRILRINTSGAAIGNVSGNQFFNQSPNTDVDMLPSALTNILNTGASLTLEANRDILVQTDVLVNNPLGTGGSLTLRAGRSVIFSAVTYSSDGGGLTIEANSNGGSGLSRGNGQGVADLGAATFALGSGQITVEVVDSGGGQRVPGPVTMPLTLAAGAVLVQGAPTSVTFTIGSSINVTSLTISTSSAPISLSGSIFCTGPLLLNTSGLTSIMSTGLTLTGSTVRFQGVVNGQSNALTIEAGEVEVLAAFSQFSLLNLRLTSGGVQQMTIGGPEQASGLDLTTAELARLSSVNAMVVGDAAGSLRIDAFDVNFGGDLTFVVPYGDAGSSIDLHDSMTLTGGLVMHGQVLAEADLTLQTGALEGVSVVGDAIGTVGTISGPHTVRFITDVISAIPVVSAAHFSPASSGFTVAVGTTSGGSELLIPASIIEALGGATGQWFFGDDTLPASVHFGSFAAPLLEIFSPDPQVSVFLAGTMVVRSAAFSGNAATAGTVAPHITTTSGITFSAGLLILATAGGGITLLDPAADYSFAQPPSISNQQAYLRLAPPTGNMYVAAPSAPVAFNLSEIVLAMLDGTFARIELGDMRQMNITLYDRRGAYRFPMKLLSTGSGVITFANQGAAITVTGTLEAGTSTANQIVLENSIASSRLTLRGLKRVETSISLSSTAFVTGIVFEGPIRITSAGVVGPSVTLSTPGISAIDGLDIVGNFGDCTIHGQLTNAIGIDVLGNIVVDRDITAAAGLTTFLLRSANGTVTLGGTVNAGSARVWLQASELSLAGNIITTGDVWITANGGRDLTFASAADATPSLDLTSAKLARFIGTSRMRLVANAIDLQAFSTAWRLDLITTTTATFHGTFSTSAKIEVSGQLALTPGTTVSSTELQVFGAVRGSGLILTDTFSSLGAQTDDLSIRTLTPGRPIVLGTSSTVPALLINWRSNLVSGKVTIGDAAGSSAVTIGQASFTSSFWPVDLTIVAGTGLPISIDGPIAVEGKLRFDSPVSVPGSGYLAVRHHEVIGNPMVPDLYFAAGGWVGGTLTILSTWFDTLVPFTGGGEIVFADPDPMPGRELAVNGPSIFPGPSLSLALLARFNADGASLGFASFGEGNMRLYGGPVAIDFPLNFHIYQLGGKLIIDDSQGPLLLGPSGGLFVTGPGTTIIVNTDILSQGAPIELDDGVEIAAPDITIATDANGAAAGAPITFMRQVNSSVGEFNNLTLRAGTTGQIEFVEQVGASADRELGGLQVIGASAVLVNGGLIATRDGQDYGADVLIGADALFASSGGGAIDFRGVLQAQEWALSVRAAEIDFGGIVSGTSSFNIETDQPNRDIELLGADDPAQLDLTESDMANISAGFSLLTIGRGDGSGLLLVSDELILLSDAELRMPAQGGIIRSTRPIRGSDGTRITITGPGTTFETAGGIITRGGQIIINDGVRLLDDSLFDTTDGGLFAAGALVTINGQINSAVAAGHALVLDAGAAAVTLQGEVGTAVNGALGSIEVNAQAGVAINGGIIRTGGTQIYNAPASFGNGTTFASTGGDVTFNGVVSGIPSVQVAPGTGIVTFNQAVGYIGTFTSGPGQIFVFNAGVEFGTLVVHGGSVSVNTIAATAATLQLSGGMLTGTAPLAVTAGGTITGGTLGGGQALTLATGAVVQHPSGQLTVQRPITISGTYAWTGGSLVMGSSDTELRVAAGGVLSLVGAGTLTGGRLVNSGRVSIAAVTPVSWADVRVQNTAGTFELLLGQMAIGLGSAAAFENAARLALTGSARLSVTGAYQQSPGATLAMTVLGMGATSLVPRLEVSGAAAIAGTLSITLLGSFASSALGSAPIITAGALSGRFTQTLLASSTSAKGIVVLFSFTGTGLTLSLGRPAVARV